MACRSFNSPIARARFCVSARVIDPRRSRADPSSPFPIRLSFSLSLFLKYSGIGILESSLLEMFCNLRFWLMLPSRWSNDRSIGSGLPSLPISVARPLSALRRYFRYYDSPRMPRATTIDPGSGDLDGFRILGDHPVKDLLPSSLTLLNPIDSRRCFETDYEMYCPEISPSIFVCSKNI